MAVKRAVNKNVTSWFYDFRVRGVRYRGAIPEARNKQQAEMAETRIRNEVFDGRFGGARISSKVKELVEDVFLPWATSNRKSWHKDAARIAPILKFFGDKRFDEISPLLVEKFKMVRRTTPIVFGKKSQTAKRVTKPRSVASVNCELSMLSRIFNLAIVNGEATVNPCIKVKRRYAHATDAGRRRVVEALTLEAAESENLVKIWSRKASGSERG